MIIDAHQHFWKYDPIRDAWITAEMSVLQRDYLPSDLEPILKHHAIDGCVAVQADQSENETLFLAKLARDNQFIKGVVGWVDLKSSQIHERLDFFSSQPIIKGFRHIVQGEPDENFLLKEDFCNGIASLAQFGFTYDILIYPHQLPATINFVKKFPDQPFVVDHLSKPLIKDKRMEPWKSQMMELSKFENTWCKLSGMVTEADLKDWKEDDFQPYMEVVFEAFGVNRIMYGSDWPVCLLTATYEEQYQIINNYISKLSPSEKSKVLGGNAVKFYHL